MAVRDALWAICNHLTRRNRPFHVVRYGVDRVVTPQLYRPLSPQERWYWIADQMSPVNVLARVRVDGKIPAELLVAAAAALAAEYPLLRVAITADADGTHPSFVPSTQPIDIRTLTGDDVEWQRQVDSYELATSLDWHTGPLVRLVHVVGNSGDVHDLVLTGSHIVVDGFTVIWLLVQAALARRPSEPVTRRHPDDLTAGGRRPRRFVARPLSRCPGLRQVREQRCRRRARHCGHPAPTAATGDTRPGVPTPDQTVVP